MIFKQSVALCAFSVLILAKPDGKATKEIVEDDELAFVENVDPDSVDHLSYERSLHPDIPQKRTRMESSPWEDPEETSTYWYRDGQNNVRNQLLKPKNTKVAKNVIMFLGDGMGISTVTASRILSGQRRGQKGEESSLAMENFPTTGLSKTYCIDKQTADSACTATAYLCGIKARFFTLGVNGKVKVRDCTAAKDPANRVYSLAYYAQQAGKSTGIVTTVTVTHASPGGAFGHTSHRLWESDGDIVKMGADPKKCEDLATQLVFGETGQNFNVILGGGRTKFFPKQYKDSEGNIGERLDHVNLINEWRRKHLNGRVVFSKSGLDKVNYNRTDALLGLFAPSYMSYNLLRDKAKEPSLSEMTLSAIKMVENNQEGYFLFIEGGRIDGANHENRAQLALDETIEFSKAIEAALDRVNLDETLIVVTADHSHSLTINGFAERGTDILGTMNSIAENVDADGLESANDGKPFAILNYGTGPGLTSIRDKNGSIRDLKQQDMKNPLFAFPAIYNTTLASHAGEDVAVYAIGPHSHLFSGVYGQHTIPHLINYASCTGKGINVCNTRV